MKIGRNEPCPCGSGRKYKRCCWEESQFPEVRRRDEERAAYEKRAAAMTDEEREQKRRDTRRIVALVLGLAGCALKT